MKNQRAGMQTIKLSDGAMVPVRVPNDAIQGKGFYVSYNAVDRDIYGSDTTALVKGQMQAFYILNGNHMAAYFPLIDEGFDACMAYFETNIDKINKYSDKPADRGSAPEPF